MTNVFATKDLLASINEVACEDFSILDMIVKENNQTIKNQQDEIEEQKLEIERLQMLVDSLQQKLINTKLNAKRIEKYGIRKRFQSTKI